MAEKITFVVIEPSGEVRTESADGTDNGRLSALKAAVGGWLEGVSVMRPGMFAYVNEEGDMLDLEPNLPGSRLLRRLGSQAMFSRGGVILGPVVLVGRMGSHEISLTEDDVAEIRMLAK